MEQEQKHRSRLLGWLGAACALALIWACVPARQACAQSSTVAASGTAKSAHPATAIHTGSTTSAHSKSKRRKKTARGQQKIDAERAQAIQEALVREHYLSRSAAGTWNQASEDAMRRYQADHGWQSKTVPDSRALISLGLGPSHDHLLNPESAMTTGPSAPRAASLTPASHSANPVAAPATPGQDVTTPQ